MDDGLHEAIERGQQEFIARSGRDRPPLLQRQADYIAAAVRDWLATPPSPQEIDAVREAVLDGLRRLAQERGDDLENGVDEFHDDEYEAIARDALLSYQPEAGE